MTQSTQQKNYSVLIADSHPVFAKGLYYTLKATFQGDTFYISHSKCDAITLAQQKPQTNLLLLDLSFYISNGISDLEQLLRDYQDIPTIIVYPTLHTKHLTQTLQNAIKQGACGYISKSATSTDFTQAIQCAKNGLHYLPKIEQHNEESQLKQSQSIQNNTSISFTPREIEVIMELCKGLPNKDISDKLAFSRSSLKRHLEKIYKKLNVNNRTSCVVKVNNLNLF